MKSADTVGIVFVNTVVGRGVLNGVINLSFGAFNFTPKDDGENVDVDPVVACRLRMDKICATQLRDTMNELLALIDKAEAEAAAPEAPKADGLVAKVRAESLN